MTRSNIPVFYADAKISGLLDKHRDRLADRFTVRKIKTKDAPPEIGPEGAIFVVDAETCETLSAKTGDRNAFFIVPSSADAVRAEAGQQADAFKQLLPEDPDADTLLFSLLHAASVLAMRAENKLLEEKLLASETEMEDLAAVGIALSAERDIDALLELILTNARVITASDAGSLYLVEDADTPEPKLRFMLAQNDSREVHLKEFVMSATHESLAGYAAIEGVTLNIADAYGIPGDAPYKFDRTFDKETGYRTRSMLVVPMKTHTGEITGVLQLINRKTAFEKKLETTGDFAKHVIPYSGRTENHARALGSQAAVALENTRLYEEIRVLFEGFVRASAIAIEARDPATSGHSNRVATLSVGLAKAVNNCEKGPFKDAGFSKEQLRELEYAALLHDFGKIGVREAVLVKEKKLFPSELQCILDRLAYMKKEMELEAAEKKIKLLQDGGTSEDALCETDEALKNEIEKIDSFIRAVNTANEPRLLQDDTAKMIAELGKQTVPGSPETPLLSPEELKRLSIPRGSLDDDERMEIESHVAHSYNFLVKIPWMKSLRSVPEIAYLHHEKLNGRGYPRGLGADDLPMQGRIMCIVDIFDALTASDRPYKPAVPVEKAMGILSDMAENGHLDKDLLSLFSEAKVYNLVL